MKENSILRKENSSISDLIYLETALIQSNIISIIHNDLLNEQLESLSKEFAKRSLLNDDHKGNIYFMSIGKSVPMLDKVVATMKSLSFPAFVIDAVHILHGDFGAISKDDLVIAVSKSGHTKELNTTLQYLKSMDIDFWYMTMANKDDKEVLDLVKLQNNTIFLNRCSEIDQMERIPTVSPIIFQIVLDSVAVYAAGVRCSMTPGEFLMNHPGGDIGKFLKNELNTTEKNSLQK